MRRWILTMGIALVSAGCVPRTRFYDFGEEYLLDLNDANKGRALGTDWTRQPAPPSHLDQLVMWDAGAPSATSVVVPLPLYDALWVHDDSSMLIVRRIRGLARASGHKPELSGIREAVDDYAKRLVAMGAIDDPRRLRGGRPYLVRDFYTNVENAPDSVEIEWSAPVRIDEPIQDAPNVEAARFVVPRADGSFDRVTLVGVRPFRNPFLVILFELAEPKAADHHADLYRLFESFALSPKKDP